MGCTSLDYVYRMEWAEFKLRLIGFNRSEERELIKLRRLGWITLIAPYQNPKKLRGMKEHRWWPIGEAPKVTEDHKKIFLEEYKKYLEKEKRWQN